MSLTGTDHALMPAAAGLMRAAASRAAYQHIGPHAKLYALSHLARSGATRSNYHSPRPFLVIDGVPMGQHPRADALDPGVLIDSLSITDLLNEQPNRCAFVAVGFHPTEGQRVVITLGSINNTTRLFAGRILTADQVYLADNPVNRAYAVNAIDDTWGLTKLVVSERYTTAAYEDIWRDLIATYAPGYRAVPQAGLGTIDEITFTNQDLPNALSQVAKRGGYTWYCDELGAVRLFATNDWDTPPTVLNAAHLSVREIHAQRDLSQVVTRVFVEGGGSNASAAVPVGETILPIDDASWYQAGGGVVVSGPQRIAYSGIYPGGGGGLIGPGASPTGTPNPAATPGTGLADGTRDYAVTYVTAAGESLVGPRTTITVGPLPTPATAPTVGAPTLGSGPDPGLHDYAVSFVTSAGGETLVGPRVTAATGVTAAPTTSPIPGAAHAGAGVDQGLHDYAATFVTSVGETTAGPIGSPVNVGATLGPTTAPTPGVPQNGGGADPGVHEYAATFVTGTGETTPGPVGPTVTVTGMPAPTTGPTPGVPQGGAGADPGVHDYAATFLTATGETTPGPFGPTVTVGGMPAPTTAPTAGAAQKGNGVDLGTHDYAATFVTATGETTAGPIGSAVVVSLTQPPSIAPTAAAGSVWSGTGIAAGTYDYETTFVTGVGETTAGPPSAGVTVTPPASTMGTPSLSAGTSAFAGTVPAGTWIVVFASSNADGTVSVPTAPSPAVTTDGSTSLHTDNVPLAWIFASLNGGPFQYQFHQQDFTLPGSYIGGAYVVTVPAVANKGTVNLSNIQIGDANVIARRIWRRTSGTPFQHVLTINNNSSTTGTDALATPNPGTLPGANTAGAAGQVPLTAIPKTTDPTVTARRLYRRSGGAGLRLVTTIAGNTSTTYLDVMPNASLGVAPPSASTASVGQVPLTAIPRTSDPAVTARRVYRRSGGYDLRLVTTIADTTTTTYLDVTPNASLGAAPPAANTASVGQVPLTTIPKTTDANVTARRLYRRSGGYDLRLVTTIADATSTTYLDVTPNASLGAAPPAVNTATIGQVPLTAIPKTTDPNVTARRLYRRSGGYDLRLLATIADPTTTTYLDVTPNAALGVAPPALSSAVLSRLVLSAIPLGPSAVASRKVYRTAAGAAPLKLLVTVADNTTTTYVDTTPDASLGATDPTASTAAMNRVTLSAIPLGASTVTQRKLYRTAAGSATLRLLVAIADHVTTTYLDAIADGSLGALPPATDTSGLSQPEGYVLAGASSIQIASIGAFPSSGWASIGNGQQVVRYQGLSGNVLTGIPVTGPGSIEVSISFNSTVNASAQLVGIPASGPGRIRYAIPTQDAVNQWVQVDDLAAQATLAALLTSGGLTHDGVIEDYIQDRRLSYTEAVARGRAQLALRSAVVVGLTYHARDLNTRSGRTVEVNLPSLGVAGVFQVQDVTISQFGIPDTMPLFAANASTRRFTFEDLLRIARDNSQER